MSRLCNENPGTLVMIHQEYRRMRGETDSRRRLNGTATE
jgi:hypothetical protein